MTLKICLAFAITVLSVSAQAFEYTLPMPEKVVCGRTLQKPRGASNFENYTMIGYMSNERYQSTFVIVPDAHGRIHGECVLAKDAAIVSGGMLGLSSTGTLTVIKGPDRDRAGASESVRRLEERMRELEERVRDLETVVSQNQGPKAG